MHVMAHNGTLEGIHDNPDFELGRFRPLGETDTEFAFCHMLADMEKLWLSQADAPPLSRRMSVFTEFANKARKLGSANLLYADGDFLFVQANRRHQEDGTVRAPGLHMLRRRYTAPRQTLSGQGFAVTSDIETVTLVASVPLTDEDWQPLPENTILALQDGDVITRA
jgi:glutamine amidotransferase